MLSNQHGPGADKLVEEGSGSVCQGGDASVISAPFAELRALRG